VYTDIVLRSVQAVQRELPEPGRSPPRAASGFLAGALLLLVGCEQASPPNFLQTLRGNCEHGSAEACSMLNTVDPDEDPDISPPIRSREIVQAILAGMRQGRQHADSVRKPVVEQPDSQ
jgi:hypothetical protein